MFSDGLHNLSDFLALAVSFWAEKVKYSQGSEALTYGWRRAEVLGGLFNGMFLLSSAVFIALQVRRKARLLPSGASVCRPVRRPR